MPVTDLSAVSLLPPAVLKLLLGSTSLLPAALLLASTV